MDEFIIRWNYSENCQPEFVSIKAGRKTTEYGNNLLDVDWSWLSGFWANYPALSKNSNAELLTPEELLLFLYKKFSVDLAKIIDGAMAYVIWDSHFSSLLAVSDRMGIENLYYMVNGDIIWVSNRIEHLLQVDNGSKNINLRSLVGYLNNRTPLFGETFYENIHTVPSGNLLLISPGKIQKKTYWELLPGPMLRLSTDNEYAEAYLELFQNVVRQYAQVNCKAAITLSGGLDSTSLASILRSLDTTSNLSAIRWIAPELPEADEDLFSAEVSEYLDLPSLSLRMDLAWPLQADYGIATRQSSPIYLHYADLWEQTFKVASCNSNRIIFTGAFGDNLFGGIVYALADLVLQGRWREFINQFYKHLKYYPSYNSAFSLFKKGVLGPILNTYLLGWIKGGTRPVMWLKDEYRQCFRKNFGPPSCYSFSLPGRIQRVISLSDQWSQQAVKFLADVASKYGIELRHPYLDHRLVEFAARLPSTQTYRIYRKKEIVRNAMRGRLPDHVLTNPKDILPNAVFYRGLREREQEKVIHLLTRMRLAEIGLVKEERLKQEYLDFVDKKHSRGDFWNALCIEDWLRRWF